MEFLSVIPFVIASLLFVMLVGSAFNAFYAYRFAKPSEFAAGVARSLTSDPRDWDYDANENWLISEKAALSICLHGHFGKVETRYKTNRGTDKIDVFTSADGRAFRKAFNEWRELTAVERRMTAEKRKRDALIALAA